MMGGLFTPCWEMYTKGKTRCAAQSSYWEANLIDVHPRPFYVLSLSAILLGLFSFFRARHRFLLERPISFLLYSLFDIRLLFSSSSDLVDWRIICGNAGVGMVS